MGGGGASVAQGGSSLLTQPAAGGRAPQGIGIVYPRGSRREDLLVGRRMHDIECDGTRLYEVLRSARFVVITAAATDGIAVDWHGPRACHRWPRNCRRSRLAGVATDQGPLRYPVSDFGCEAVHFTYAVSSH
jgi:hypothetical protein